MLFMAAEIQLPTLEVTGVSCVALLLTTASPPVWESGKTCK